MFISRISLRQKLFVTIFEMVHLKRMPLKTSVLFTFDCFLVRPEFCSHSLACTRDGQVNALHGVSNCHTPLLTFHANPSHSVGKHRPILGAFSFAGPFWLHSWFFNCLPSHKVRTFLAWHWSRFSGVARPTLQGLSSCRFAHLFDPSGNGLPTSSFGLRGENKSQDDQSCEVKLHFVDGWIVSSGLMMILIPEIAFYI